MLEVKNLRAGFGAFSLDVSFSVGDKERVVILGPSGSGKTTLLRLIAGLVPAASGDIVLDGRNITCVPPQDRGVGMVFQDFALFPHMNAWSNAEFALASRRPKPPHIAAEVAELFRLFKLEGLEKRSLEGLSGGERQRLALARSLASRPSLMLFDEPLSSLDVQLRDGLRRELNHFQQQQGYSSIFVTHDQAEALAGADRLMVMRGGKILQFDTPETVYRHPASAFVAEFVGRAIELGSEAGVVSYCRPEAVHLEARDGDMALSAVVESCEFRGDCYELALAAILNGYEVKGLTCRSDHRVAPGTTVRPGIEPGMVFSLADDRIIKNKDLP